MASAEREAAPQRTTMPQAGGGAPAWFPVLALSAGAGALLARWLAHRAAGRPSAGERAGGIVSKAPGQMSYATLASSQGNLPINMYRTGHDLVVLAPVPGLAPEDLALEFRDDTLTIRGKLRGPGQEDRNYLFREWAYGPSTRIVQLPFPVATERVNVFLRHGVLSIVMPMGERTEPRRIELRTHAEEAHAGRVRLIGHGHEASARAPHGAEHERLPEPLTPGAAGG